VRLPGWYQARSVAGKLRRLTAGRLPAGLSARLVSLCADLATPVYRFGRSHTARALRRLARDARPWLSSDQMLDQATSRLLEKLEGLKGDVARGLLGATVT